MGNRKNFRMPWKRFSMKKIRRDWRTHSADTYSYSTRPHSNHYRITATLDQLISINPLFNVIKTNCWNVSYGEAIPRPFVVINTISEHFKGCDTCKIQKADSKHTSLMLCLRHCIIYLFISPGSRGNLKHVSDIFINFTRKRNANSGNHSVLWKQRYWNLSFFVIFRENIK